MEESILTTIKKLLGISEDYTAFDLDVTTHINSVFSTLTQLGIGPVGGFAIEDDVAVWSDFLEDDLLYKQIRSYIFLKVKQLFDPANTSYLITAQEKQSQEMEWRMNVDREDTDWTDPDPVITTPCDPVPNWG